MTQTLEHIASAPACERGAILTRFFELLDRHNVPACILHGYQEYPEVIGSDVDCLLPANMLPGPLARLLHDNQSFLGAQVVQWFNDDAHWLVLASTEAGARPVFLQLHISCNYEIDGRRLYPGQEILAQRVRRGDFWIPPAEMEFACVSANRVSKLKLTERHGIHLSRLYNQNPAGCKTELRKFFPAASADVILEAAATGAWQTVATRLTELKASLHARAAAAGTFAKTNRRVNRFLAPPCGLHVVFLGPDGVGKTTIIDAVREELTPAFLEIANHTFAPGLLPDRWAPAKPDGPHSLPPRSYFTSLIKAAWWLVFYTLGYYRRTRPKLARGQLVLNHRYLPDAIVDPKRYRYSGPRWLVRAIWWIAPKPDLLLVLNAPAAVIHARKQEVPFPEIERQVSGYRQLAHTSRNSHLIDATRTISEEVDEIIQVALGFLALRVRRRRETGDLR